MINWEMVKNIDWEKTGVVSEKIRAISKKIKDKAESLGRRQKLAIGVFAVVFLVVLLGSVSYKGKNTVQPVATTNVNEMLSNENADVKNSNQPAVSEEEKTSFMQELSEKWNGVNVPFSENMGKMIFSDQSREIKVPQDFDSIQKAIDAARKGDVVMVSAGEYKGLINMKDGVSVIGEKAETTVLDGEKNGNVVTFKDITTNDTRLENFTIKNAKESLGGVLVENSSPIINRNIIVQNDYDIYIKGESSPLIQRNRLSESKAGVQVFNLGEIKNSNPLIVDNFIFGNKKGINIYKGNATIEHNTISFNSSYGIDAGASFGIYLSSASAGIKNNVITDNGICEICAGVFADENSKDVKLSFNDVWNNQSNFVCMGTCQMEDNNLSDDPKFENGLLFNFTLKSDSPFLNSGSDGQKLGSRI